MHANAGQIPYPSISQVHQFFCTCQSVKWAATLKPWACCVGEALEELGPLDEGPWPVGLVKVCGLGGGKRDVTS